MNNNSWWAFVTVCQVQLDSQGFDDSFSTLKSYIYGYYYYYSSAHQPESLPNERAAEPFQCKPMLWEAQPKATEMNAS